jgi:hypothetical protein
VPLLYDDIAYISTGFDRFDAVRHGDVAVESGR